MTHRLVPLTLVLLLTAIGATVAAAAGNPVPGCAGIAGKDAAGDQTANQQKTPDNTDIKELFFRNDNGVVTANVKLADVNKTVPSPYTSINLYVLWQYADPANPTTTNGYVEWGVTSDGTENFEYGTLGGNSFTRLGDTKGQIFEGKDGIVSIEIPAAAIPADKKLPGPYADARVGISEPLTGRGIVSRADSSTAGKTYNAAGCVDGASAPTPTPPSTTPPPSATPPAQPPAQPQPAPVTINVTKARAKGRVVSVSLRSSEDLTALTGTLKKGSRTLGRGRLARLARTGTVKIKLKKKLKKGSYSFAVAAKDASGRNVSGTFKIKL